jgi:hypothetical protein
MDGQELQACDDPCSHCDEGIVRGAALYKIDYDIRHQIGNRITILHAETIATLCA